MFKEEMEEIKKSKETGDEVPAKQKPQSYLKKKLMVSLTDEDKDDENTINNVGLEGHANDDDTVRSSQP